MAQSEWPRLGSLHVPNNRLGHGAMTQLARCSLPKLTTLNLSHNHLDEVAMTALVQGSWPELRTVSLAANRSLNGDALAVIPTAASWSLS